MNSQRIEEQRINHARRQEEGQGGNVTRGPSGQEEPRARGHAHRQNAINPQGIQGRTAQPVDELAQLQTKITDSRNQLNAAEQKLRTAYQNLKNAEDAYEAFAPAKTWNEWKVKEKAASEALQAKHINGGDDTAENLAWQTATIARKEAENRRQTIIDNNPDKARALTKAVRDARDALESPKRAYSELITAHDALWIKIRNISDDQGKPQEIQKQVVQVKSEVEYHRKMLDLNEKILEIGNVNSTLRIASVMAVLFMIIAVVLYATNNLSQLSFLNGLSH